VACPSFQDVRTELIKFSAKQFAFFFVHCCQLSSSQSNLPSNTLVTPVFISTVPFIHLHLNQPTQTSIYHNGFRERYVLKKAADVIEETCHATAFDRPLSWRTAMICVLETQTAIFNREIIVRQLDRRFGRGHFATKSG